MRKYGNEVQERSIWINRSGHDYIGNNLADCSIPHGDSLRTGMYNINNGTTNNCSVQPSDTNDLRHGMSNNVSQVLNHNVKSSYSLSRVIPQGNPCGISHVRKYGNEVHKRNLRTKCSSHNSIGNNLGDGDIPHGNSHQTGMQNMDDGTMSSCSTIILLGPPNTTRESPDDYSHD